MCLSFVLFILFAVVRLGCNGLTFAKEKKTQKRDNTNTHLVCVFRKEHRAARSFIRRRGHHHHGTKDEGRRTTMSGGNEVAPCHFQERDQFLESAQNACENCGGRDHLMKCSRCHAAFFCSVKCQKTYWPFHKAFCRKNDFADATEGTEPKFARWMRSHGKQAVLKDGASEVSFNF